MAVPTLDEALNEAYTARNGGGAPGGGTLNLSMALSVAKAAGTNPYYQTQRELYKDVTPPMELTMPKMPTIPQNPLANVRPEDTLTAIEPPERGITDSLRQGVANMINGLSTPQSVTETRKWLAGLDDAQFQQAIRDGLVGWEDLYLAHLPQGERAKHLMEANDLSGGWDRGVASVADFIAPGQTKEPEGWWAQTVHKGLEALPGIAANVGKFALLGPTGYVAANTMSGNAAAREQVFNNQIAQGKTVPEAAAQANSFGWNAADVLTRGATDAATMAAFGAAPNLYGGISPALQRAINVAKGAGISGVGAAGESVIGNKWSGQDADWTGAAKAGAGSAAATGLFGLLNMGLKAGDIAKEHKTWKFIRDFNNVVKDYGVPPLSETGNNLGDVAGFTENVIASGQLPPDKAVEMLVRLGASPDEAMTAVSRLSRQPRIDGAQEADFAQQWRANNPTPPETGPTPALPSGGLPGMTRDETARRAGNLLNIINGGQQVQNAENQRTALGFMERYGVNVMGQRPELPSPKPQTPQPGSKEYYLGLRRELIKQREEDPGYPYISDGRREEMIRQVEKVLDNWPEEQTQEPKGALATALEETKTAETKPSLAGTLDELKNTEWGKDHLIIGGVGEPKMEPEKEPTTTAPKEEYLNRKKSLSSGSSSPTSAPAPTSIPSATSGIVPESNGDRPRYEDSDIKETIPQPAEGVKEQTLGKLNVEYNGKIHILKVKTTGATLELWDKDGWNLAGYDPKTDEILFHPMMKNDAFKAALGEQFRKHISDFIKTKQNGGQTDTLPEPQIEPTPKTDVVVPPVREDEKGEPKPGPTAEKKGGAAEVKEKTPREEITDIPKGTSFKQLRRGTFKFTFEGSNGTRDVTINVNPWQTRDGTKTRLYLNEVDSRGREAYSPGYYDLETGKFIRKKNSFFDEQAEREFRKHIGDFWEHGEEPEKKGSAATFRDNPDALTNKTAKSPSMTVAERVAEHIGIIETGNTKTHPGKIETKDLTAMADRAFGGTMAEGKYSIKDAYDAMEMGVNKAIQNGKISPSDDINDIARDLDKLRIIEDALPTQANRTEEQVEFQQFSTPPRIAYIANWLSGVGKGDVVLEPSAGVGGLAVFAKDAGAEVVMNEFSDRRAGLLEEMKLGKVYRENAEHIDDVLPDDVKPTKVIMNPPFSSTAGRMKGKKNDTKNATLHVEQALSRLEDGGRLVAILGKGMNDDAPAFRDWWRDIKKRYNVRANVLLDGKEYRKYGTTFGNVIVVIDKTGPTPEGGTFTGSFDTVEDLASSKELRAIRADAPKPEASKPKAEPETGTGNKPKSRFPNYRRKQQEKEETDKDDVNERVPSLKKTSSGAMDKEQGFSDATLPETTPPVTGREQSSVSETSLPQSAAPVNVASEMRRMMEEAPDRIFYRIPDLRAALREQGISDAEFEGQLKQLRDSETIQLHSSDVTGMTPEQSRDRFKDENGFIFGTFTVLDKNALDKAAKTGPGQKTRRTETAAKTQRDKEPEPTVKVESKTEEERREERKAEKGDDLNVYDSYSPSRMRIKGAKPHPADLVESAAMASVSMPKATYSPHLPEKVINDGLLSEAQLEAVTYAGQAFKEKNKDGTRRGFFIGDGTGVGKGREISGVLTDQMRQGHGKGKAVWVSDKATLSKDAQRDWSGLGNDPEEIFSQQKTRQGEAIKNEKGICFTAYSTLRGKDRLEQLKKWLGKGFDGVIVLDEVHNANNAMDSKGTRGTRKASAQALATMDLVREFPDARVLYVSATGATEVRNLAMLDRLGLWGEGTPFASKQDFVSKIDAGGTAAMEIVARDMKAMGLYVARSLSQRAGPHGGPEDVTFSRLTHELTTPQKAVYDKIAEAWRAVFMNIKEAVKICGGKDTKDAGRALSVFFGMQQKCMSQVVTALKTPSVIEAIKKDLKEDKSVIIQLTETGDAATKRALERLGDEESYDDLDVTPRDNLINFLQASFPVNKLEEYTDDDGNTRIREVQDRDGKPVMSKEAVRMRDNLIADVNSIRFPETPLDMILNAFGTDQVAEVTGRTMRIVKGPDGERVRENRSVSSREADKAAFNEGKKRILIFSEAGGTGASYHASREYKNQEKRVHYLLQPGWKADKAIQGLGRSHRSNEAHKPHYVLVETDLPGEKRFTSTIARRLEQTGALTMGERKTTTQGLFGERDNLESPHARDAMRDLFAAIIRGVYTDMGSPAEVLEQLGYDYERFKGADAASFPPVTQFLNRILAMSVDMQKKLFAHFEEAIDNRIAWAIQHGQLDVGTENVRADKIKILQEKVVHEDPERGTETSYVELELSTRQRPRTMNSVKAAGYEEFYKSNRSGRIVAARKTKRTETDTATGELLPVYQLVSVDPRYHSNTSHLDKTYYTKLDVDEARELWKSQAAELPEYYVEKKHMITGVLLPIWDRLSDSSPRIQRVMTDDGRSYLGRLIPDGELAGTLGRLKVDYEGEKVSPAEMFTKLEKLGTTATLGNGWKLKTVMLNGEKRIEIIGPNFTWNDTLRNAGAIVELVGFVRRTFIPQGNEELMKRILDMSPVVSVKARDILDEAADAINENIPEDVAYRLNIVHPWFANIALAETNPMVERAEAAEPAFSEPETEKRYQEADGVKPETGLGRMRRYGYEFLHGLRGDYPELAGESVSGVPLVKAQEWIRKMNREGGAQVQKAIKTLEASLKPLSAREFDLFTRVRILQDLQYQKSSMPGSLLPYGWTDESFQKDYDKFMGYLEKSPKVQQVIEREEATIAALNEEMTEVFDRLGWHSLRDKFKNPHYFRHVVLEYANAAASGGKKHNNGKAPDNRSYLKRRKGSDKDISANYIQAMGEVRAQMFQDIATGRMLSEIKGEYNIIEQLKREAFVMNEDAIKEHLAEAAKALNEGLSDDEARESAEAQFRKKFNQKQAMALSRLFTLARNGDLPEGDFGDVVDAMERAGTIEDMPQEARKRFNRYLGWLAGLDERSAARDTARGYFKGVAEKKKGIKAALGDEYLDWRDLVPDGYAIWDPFNSRLVFSVSTVPENILKMAEEDNKKDIHVTLADLVKMKVLGGHRQLWVIPAEIAATLDKLGEKKVRGLLGSMAKELTTLWKKNVLFNPWRVAKYNFRNFSGDLDAAVAGSPGILLHFPKAFAELFGVFYRGKAAKGDLKDFQERGGALTADSMQELYDWKGMREFRHLAPKEREKLGKRLRHIGSGYMEIAETFTQWRESWLRYAAYLFFKKDMEKHGGTPTRWGASKPEEVMALADIRDRAYKMANELMGAYDQVSETGKYLRDNLIPFYSWKEVNFKREVQMFRNGAKGRSWIEADIRQLALGRGGGGGPKDPTGGALTADDGGERFHWTSLLGFALRLPTVALRIAAILATNFWLWGAMCLYNQLCWHDEEERLPQGLKDRPHIIVGRDDVKDATYYFDRLGALPDFLENFGLDQFVTDLRQIWNGQKSWGDFMSQIAEAPVSAFWNGLNPLIKNPIELGFGRTGFPNVFKPRAIRDTIDYVASALAVKWPVAAIRSIIEDRPGPDFWSVDHTRDFVTYTARPRMEAYYHILDLKRQYQESVLGKSFDGFATTKRGIALGNMKTAMRHGDYEKAGRWADRYYEMDGTRKGMKSSIEAMHPEAGLSKQERWDFEDWLTEQDRKYLDMALDYFFELKDDLAGL